MKLVLVVLFLLLALPLAVWPSLSVNVSLSYGSRSVACFARCSGGAVQVGTGLAALKVGR